MNRRDFLGSAAAGAIAASAAAASMPACAWGAARQLQFEISVIESSLARSLQRGRIDHLDVVRIANTELEISAVEYASRFFADKAQDEKYLAAMNKQAAQFGVRQLLIVVDSAGLIAGQDSAQRKQALQDHRQWIDAARALGCHSVQINPISAGTAQEQLRRAADSIAELCQYAAVRQINVLLGDYGGLSADAKWVADVVKTVNHPCCGTHPQINNLQTDADFARLAALAAWAKGIAAVAADFDEQGRERSTDYARALAAVQQAGYRGYIGIHYTGDRLDEYDGIRATKQLLQRVRASMQPAPPSP